MTATFYVLLVLSVLLATAFVLVQGNQKRPLTSIMLKTFASVCVVALGLFGTIETGLISTEIGALFVIGLVCCLVGDVLLQLFDITSVSKYHLINMGSFAFMLAHFCFIAGMGIMMKTNTLAIVVPILVGLVIACAIYFMQKPMKLDYNKSTLSILAYSFALGTSLSFGVSNLIVNGASTFGILLVVGLALFFLSDLVLSLIYFKEKSNHNLYYPNLSIYYSAIIVIAVALCFAM